jgi:hypothetical protein
MYAKKKELKPGQVMCVGAVALAGSLLALALASGCSGGEGESPLGKPCETAGDCRGSLFCDTPAAPTAGMCTVECWSTDECRARFGDDTSCIGAGRCVRTCSSREGCLPDQLCNVDGWCVRARCDNVSDCYAFTCDVESGACRTSCQDETHCQSGFFCDTDLEVCFPYE